VYVYWRTALKQDLQQAVPDEFFRDIPGANLRRRAGVIAGFHRQQPEAAQAVRSSISDEA
jgi:hypothetical protein